MPLKAADFDRVVGKLVPGVGKKHQFWWFVHDGKKVLYTERSQGRGELGRVEFAIRRQLKVSGSQLRDLANCPMTRDAYVQHLRETKVLPSEEPAEAGSLTSDQEREGRQ